MHLQNRMQAATLEAKRVLTCEAANGVKETQDEIAAILSDDAGNDKRTLVVAILRFSFRISTELQY